MVERKGVAYRRGLLRVPSLAVHRVRRPADGVGPAHPRWLDTLLAAAHFPSSVYRAMKRSPEGAVQMLAGEFALVRTQDLPEVVYDAGMFYWGTAAAWLAQRPVLGGHSAAVHHSQDESA